MLRFDVSVYGSAKSLSGPLSVSFEQTLAVLQQFDRLFIEPDGSFVWTGSTPDGQRWQVDGNLIDRGDCLAYVELKGHCPNDQLDLLLTVLGWPQASLVFQLPRRGVLLSETEFRALAATESGAI